MTAAALNKKEDVKAIAQQYVDRGYRVVRVAPRDKHAIRKNWTDGDSPDDFKDEENIGVVCGKPSGGLTDIDLDTITASLVAPYVWPKEAPMYGRPSKPGGHLWVRCDEDITRKTYAIPGVGKAMQLEIRGSGHQSVVPGSVHPSGEPITWAREGDPPLLSKQDIEMLAGFNAYVAVLIDKAWHDGVKDDLTTAFIGDCARRRIPMGLCERGVLALCEIGGSNDVSSKVSKVSRIYNSVENDEARHVPGWTRITEIIADERLTKVLNGWLAPRGLKGNGATLLKPEDAVDSLNKRFAYNTRESMERRILSIEREPNAIVVTPHTISSARDLVAGDFVAIRDHNGKERVIPAFDYWKDNVHKKRRDVYGFNSVPWAIDEEPRTEADPNFINTFSGWPLASAIKTAKTDTDGVQFCLNHITNGICGGDTATAEYVQLWIAHILQRPNEKPGVALVLAGPQGTGKSLFIRMIGSLVPRNAFMSTSAHDQVFGRFTIQLMPLLVLGCEELVYGGNHRDDSALKDLITSSHLSYEAKGMTPFVAPNYTRFIIASNSFRPVSTQDGKRRYLFISPSEEHVGDRFYWNRLMSYLDDPATIAGLARHFAELDTVMFDPHQLPSVEKIEHKQLAATIAKANDPVLAFLHELLDLAMHDGLVLRNPDNAWNNHTGQKYAPGEYTPAKLHDEYVDFYRKLYRFNEPITRERFLLKLGKYIGPAMTKRWQRTNDVKWRSYKIDVKHAGDLLAKSFGFSDWAQYSNSEGDDGHTE